MTYKKVCKILGSLAMLLVFSGCQAAKTSAGVGQALVASVDQVENYQVTYKQKDYKIGEEAPISQSLGNASVWTDGTGYGTRIDKENGVLTNQMEVIAALNGGVIRYHQDPWEVTITAASSLQNILVYPYSTAMSLVEDLGDQVQWQQETTLGVTRAYQARLSDQAGLTKAITSLLQIPLTETAQVDLVLRTDPTGTYLHELQVTITEPDAGTRREIQIAYFDYNQQVRKSIPVQE